MMTSGPSTRRPAVPGGGIPPLPPGAVLSAGGVRTYQGFAALTVWQPWAWAIAAGLKRVENRGWKPFSLRPGDFYMNPKDNPHGPTIAHERSVLIEIYDGPHYYEKPVFHTDQTISGFLAKSS